MVAVQWNFLPKVVLTQHCWLKNCPVGPGWIWQAHTHIPTLLTAILRHPRNLLTNTGFVLHNCSTLHCNCIPGKQLDQMTLWAWTCNQKQILSKRFRISTLERWHHVLHTCKKNVFHWNDSDSARLNLGHMASGKWLLVNPLFRNHVKLSVCVYTTQDYRQGITDKRLKIWIGSGTMLWEGNRPCCVCVWERESLRVFLGFEVGEGRSRLLTIPHTNELFFDLRHFSGKSLTPRVLLIWFMRHFESRNNDTKD